MALSTHLSNHKLYLLGMLCAILAWGMACIELGANTHLWFSGLSEQGYLQAWSDEMPRLASDEAKTGAERMKAATAKASGGTGQVLKDLSAEAGAEAIFKLLREEGVIR